MTVIATIRIVKATGIRAYKLLVISAFTSIVKVIIVAIYGYEFSLLGNNFKAIVSGGFGYLRLLGPYIEVCLATLRFLIELGFRRRWRLNRMYLNLEIISRIHFRFLIYLLWFDATTDCK